MTASEFTFLALGLVLGLSSGVALIEVLRSRPPAAREVRVTVAPNAIQARMSSTLAAPHVAGRPEGPAQAGPADRRWGEDLGEEADVATTGRRLDDPTSEQSAIPTDAGTGTPVHSARPDGADVFTPRSRLAAVPMSMEPDPITAALRASAAASAVAAMAAGSPSVTASPQHAGTSGERQSQGSSSVATADQPPGLAGGSSPQRTNASAEGSNDPADGSARAATSAPAPTRETPETPTPAADGPCAEERRVADERCAVATRAREGAAHAADAMRRAQRTYDDLATRAEATTAAADARAVRTAKELAQGRFRDARNQARTRDDVEAGARSWLAEINQINHDTREATLAAERDKAALTALAPQLERLAVEADAARIAAERADEACLAAREALATCDEARTVELAAAGTGPSSGDGDEGAADDGGEGDSGGPGGGRIAAATPEPEEEFAFATQMHSQAGEDALILRILRGDRDAMQRAVARLAGDDPEAVRRWQTQLGSLAEALIARSIEASAFDFPLEHPFWGPFSQTQNRDIAAGLSSLGFRFDGFGGWVDDRIPSQRDLSLAVGYAGLDPMRVRRWPTEQETRDLLVDVRVAADEYIAGAAGGLTLGELVTMLGRRADGLTELWNQWGSVRPVLLEAS